MNILAVMANGRQELAGAGIASFAGFFSRKYREHDYTVGRNKAREYLAGRDVQKHSRMTAWTWISPNLPDTSGITNLPLPLWRILLEGKLRAALVCGLANHSLVAFRGSCFDIGRGFLALAAGVSLAVMLQGSAAGTVGPIPNCGR